MSAPAAPSFRAPLVLLLPAAALAGLGLGLLALALSLPPATVTPLPPPDTSAARALSGTADTPAAPALWAPLFGESRPEPVVAPPPPPPEPEPEPEPFDGAPYYDTSAFVLRGLAVEENGGWALLETEGDISVIREGDILPGGEEVTLITDEGVEISINGEAYFIGFEEGFDDMPPEPDLYEQPPYAPMRHQDAPGGFAPRTNYGIGSVGN